MASPNLSEIVTTTLRSRTGKLADNVTHNTALLSRLRARGKKKPVSGGSAILQELEYAENGTFMYYSGYETLNISPSDVLTSATYDFKQASVAVAMSGLEQIQNAGPEQVIDLLEARISNAEKTMTNNISAGVYSNGTGSGGKEIGGLQLLVATTPTNEVGGISGGTWPFWQNIAYSAVSNGGSAASASNIQQYMNAVWVQLVRNTDKPDLIVADNNYWSFFQGSLQAIQRITDEATAKAGWQNIMYMSAPVVLDGGFGGNAPANTMYFLNTDYIYYRPARDRDMYVPEDDRVPINQDAIVKMLLWAGNMTISNRRLQGVLYA